MRFEGELQSGRGTMSVSYEAMPDMGGSGYKRSLVAMFMAVLIANGFGLDDHAPRAFHIQIAIHTHDLLISTSTAAQSRAIICQFNTILPRPLDSASPARFQELFNCFQVSSQCLVHSARIDQ